MLILITILTLTLPLMLTPYTISVRDDGYVACCLDRESQGSPELKLSLDQSLNMIMLIMLSLTLTLALNVTPIFPLTPNSTLKPNLPDRRPAYQAQGQH